MNNDLSMLDLINSQKASNGETGWPVAVRDRIAFSKLKDDSDKAANCAVTFLWTMRDSVIPFLKTNNLALASNFYTPTGLVGMIRNILANPFIRYIILFGEEYSSKKGDSAPGAEITSANALRAFFEKGINDDRRLDGFENAIKFDENIPLDLIKKVKENVTLIDLNKEMPGAELKDKIERANELLLTLEKKQAFLDTPYVFDYEKSSNSLPFEGGPILVHGSTIPKTWVEVIHKIFTYGKDNLMNANTDRFVKEINNIVAVIHDPQNMDLSFNPFLIPLTKEKIDAYKDEILSPVLPEGKAYTYGNKLRAYLENNPNYIKNLASSENFKDFEFGKGPHVEANVKYSENFAEIDQLNDIIEVLKRDPYSKATVAMTWHTSDELMRKHKSSPCLVLIQAMVHDEKLNLTVYFRSHDMAQGWPENAYGCAAIQKKIAESIGVTEGILTVISCSAQIYNHYYAQVKDMLGKYRTADLKYDDKKGNYLISVNGDMIKAVLIHPTDSSELKSFEGKTAKEVYSKISSSVDIDSSHALYLGAELMAAQIALSENKPYVQDTHTV